MSTSSLTLQINFSGNGFNCIDRLTAMKFFQKLDTGHKVQLSGVLSALFENARVNIAENIIMVYKILKDLYNREIKNMEASDIENKINELPEDLKKEVIDFIDF